VSRAAATPGRLAKPPKPTTRSGRARRRCPMACSAPRSARSPCPRVGALAVELARADADERDALGPRPAGLGPVGVAEQRDVPAGGARPRRQRQGGEDVAAGAAGGEPQVAGPAAALTGRPPRGAGLAEGGVDEAERDRDRQQRVEAVAHHRQRHAGDRQQPGRDEQVQRRLAAHVQAGARGQQRGRAARGRRDAEGRGPPGARTRRRAPSCRRGRGSGPIATATMSVSAAGTLTGRPGRSRGGRAPQRRARAVAW
jgi:hypothetical protein